MFYRMKTLGNALLLAMFVIFCVESGAIAEDAAWHISKSSGDVWVTTSGVQPASLTDDTILKPGDNVRTGQNGRVLLLRGEETILISPNSVIGLPTETKEGLSTTIIQQAGSILLDVEKRNVKHFEVETPYLAAVVKGTQFRVSVNKYDSSVDVLRGEVEVAGFKSGQHAKVLPGQAAKVSMGGLGSLLLSGLGTLSPIWQGEPRRSSVRPVPVPKEGLSAPGSTAKGQQVRTVPPRGEIESVVAASAGPGGFSVADSSTSSPIQLDESRGSSVDPPPVSNERLSASGGAPEGPQVRRASAPGHVEALPASSGGNAANEIVWGSRSNAPSNGAGRASGRKNINDQGAIGLVLGIGITVVVAVGAKRRWQRQRQRQRQR